MQGVNIIRRALEEPLRQIANNAGEEGTVVAQKVKSLKGNNGFDANHQFKQNAGTAVNR
jgi:chaperonin GroEL